RGRGGNGAGVHLIGVRTREHSDPSLAVKPRLEAGGFGNASARAGVGHDDRRTPRPGRLYRGASATRAVAGSGDPSHGEVRVNRTVRTLCVVSFLTVMVTASMASRALSGAFVGAKVPPVICLVGTSSGEPDRATGQFTLSLYDVAQNPRAGALVIFDASQCPDLFICADQKD